jgi:tetratricopeptide (TPR) repeat protein
MKGLAALLSIAKSQSERGENAEALVTLGRALRVAPRSPHVWFEIGVVLARQGEIEEAVEAFDHALDLEPLFADAHFQKGLLLAQLGDFSAACSSLAKSAELSPEFQRAVEVELARVSTTPPPEA